MVWGMTDYIVSFFIKEYMTLLVACLANVLGVDKAIGSLHYTVARPFNLMMCSIKSFFHSCDLLCNMHMATFFIHYQYLAVTEPIIHIE